MKIREYSDIHLDHFDSVLQAWVSSAPSTPLSRPKLWYPPELPDDKETTLVLAGDLWIGTRWIEFAGFSWAREVSKQFKHVVVVLGNHDYWPAHHALTIKGGGDKCNALLQDMGIHNVYVLDASSKLIDDVLFVGATLWTNMNRGDSLVMLNLNSFMRYDGKIAYETGPNGQWSRFTPEKWLGTHRRHRDYIKHVAEQNRDKKIVVVTHHLPLPTLIDPRYTGHQSNYYYMSDISDVILDNPHIALWFYGHTHHQRDTWLCDTRLVNNCVGYVGEHLEQLGLVKHEVIEI